MDLVCISGATAGIGEACARRFAALGHPLLLLARRKERLDALCKELGAKALVVDVGEAQALAACKDAFAAVDILVNNAGLAAGFATAAEAEFADWQTMIDTNILGLVQLTHMIVPTMVARNHGHIINMGSVAGTYPYKHGNVYGASKAFVHQFTRNLKSDLLGSRVRVTSIEPGMVETEFSKVRFGGDESKAAAVYAGMQPLSADDIADTIVWAASRPAHVNINSIEVMPVQQAFAGFCFDRKANS